MSLIVRQENNWAFVLVIALISAMAAGVVIVHANNVKNEIEKSSGKQLLETRYNYYNKNTYVLLL